MSRWHTFISRFDRLPMGIRLQTDAERLLEADLPILARFQQRVAINEPRSVSARLFRAELEVKRANVAQLRINRARRRSA